MTANKAEIVAQLRKDVLLLQGYRAPTNKTIINNLPRAIQYAFPNSIFPLACMHEFLCDNTEEATASAAFIAGIAASLIKNNGALLWISPAKLIFPPALKLFGIEPHRIIFIDLKKEKERLWAMEEALKCDGISSVIGEINNISFTESRRFQLAVEQSKVTGFLLRYNPKNLASACIARWKIKPLSSQQTELPGIGFPRWNVQLLKVRNGKPRQWQIEWRAEKFCIINEPAQIIKTTERKIV